MRYHIDAMFGACGGQTGKKAMRLAGQVLAACHATLGHTRDLAAAVRRLRRDA